MPTRDEHPNLRAPRRAKAKLRLFALLLVPLLLLLNAPVLAAVVPSLLITAAALETRTNDASPPPALVAADDTIEHMRIARALPIASDSRRVDTGSANGGMG